MSIYLVFVKVWVAFQDVVFQMFSFFCVFLPDLIVDSFKMWPKEFFKDLKTLLRVVYWLELLEGEETTLEHFDYQISVQGDSVLLEEVHELLGIKAATAIGIKVLEQLLDNIVLVDLLSTH